MHEYLIIFLKNFLVKLFFKIKMNYESYKYFLKTPKLELRFFFKTVTGHNHP